MEFFVVAPNIDVAYAAHDRIVEYAEQHEEAFCESGCVGEMSMRDVIEGSPLHERLTA
jgi:hypothetical protein